MNCVRSLQPSRGVLLGVLLTWTGCSQGERPRPLAPHATFELHVVTSVESPGARRNLDPVSGAPLFPTPPPLVETADIETLALERTGGEGATLIAAMTPAGAAKLYPATSALNRGARIAVVANGRVIALPTIDAPLATSVVLGGGLIHHQGRELFDGLTRPR